MVVNCHRILYTVGMGREVSNYEIPDDVASGLWQALVTNGGDMEALLGMGYQPDLRLSEQLFDKALEKHASQRTEAETKAYIAACAYYLSVHDG